MKINTINNQVGFCSNRIAPVSEENFKQFQEIHTRLNRVLDEIDGVDNANSIPESVQIAQDKIARLRKQTEEAWQTCPPMLSTKLKRLDRLNRDLAAINKVVGQANEQMDKTPEGIVVPKKDKLFTTLEALAIYNALPKSSSDAAEIISHKKTALPGIATEELKNSLQELEKQDWNYIKFNAEDSKIYSKLKDQFIIGETKDIIDEQVKIIDKKLTDLKANSGKLNPEVGLRVYEPKETGKLMALESAKLRRTTINSQIAFPDFDKKLSAPDILAQSTPNGYLFFKIDRKFEPSKQEIRDAFELNKPYAPIVKKLFPDGLNLYIVPGYLNQKGGKYNGGEVIPNQPDFGIWLNSYDIESKSQPVAILEKALAQSRGLDDIIPSVLSGNPDRARVIAHEIGHAISYKKIQQDSASQNSYANSAFLDLSAGVDFMSAWKGLRVNAVLNNDYPISVLGNIDTYSPADQEMVAEDIRIAITGKNIPATSKMTGIFDQTSKGKPQLQLVTDYLQKCLLGEQTPIDAIKDHLKF